MANMYKDEQGHWTTKENAGGPCYHKIGKQGNKFQAVGTKGEREDIDEETVKLFRDNGVEDEEFDSGDDEIEEVIARGSKSEEPFDEDEEPTSKKVKIADREMTLEEWTNKMKNASDKELAREFMLIHASNFNMSENEMEEYLKEHFDEHKSTVDEMNKRTMRSSNITRAIENARKNGQDPQTVLDTVSYDFDIEPGSEEYNKLKEEVLRDAKLNKQTGKYEFNKYNIGSNKELKTSEERKMMEDLAQAFKDAGLEGVKVEDGYEDAGADMKWTTLSYEDESGSSWLINPREWIDYMNGNKTAEEIVNEIKNGEYGHLYKWKKDSESQEGSNSWSNEELDKAIEEHDLMNITPEFRDALMKRINERLNKK